MPAKTSQEERVLLLRFDREIVNFPNVANALDELGKLAERNTLPVTTLPDHCRKGAAVLGVWPERNLGQHR